MTIEIIIAIIFKLLDVPTVDCIDVITDDVIRGLNVSIDLVDLVTEMIVVDLKELIIVIGAVSNVGVVSDSVGTSSVSMVDSVAAVDVLTPIKIKVIKLSRVNYLRVVQLVCSPVYPGLQIICPCSSQV